MRVDPSTSQTPIALPQTETAASRSTNRAAAAPGPAPEAGAFTMTGQLAQLLSAVRDAPEVRPEAVASASVKLASGELDTPQAATDTAAAIVDNAVPPAA